MARDCALPGFARASRRVRRVMGENRLLAPHRVGRNQEKTHDGTIVTDKVKWKCGGTDMSQTVTIEGRSGPMFSSPSNTRTQKSSAFTPRASANRFEAPSRSGRGVSVLRAPSRPAWREPACVTIMAPITCPAISERDQMSGHRSFAVPSWREPRGNGVRPEPASSNLEGELALVVVR